MRALHRSPAPVLLALTVALTASSCATQFQGDAHFPGGASKCHLHCEERGLEMDSFVYAGEYSSACVCRPRGHSPQPAAQASASTVPPSVGVVMQMRAAQANKNAAQQSMMAQ